MIVSILVVAGVVADEPPALLQYERGHEDVTCPVDRTCDSRMEHSVGVGVLRLGSTRGRGNDGVFLSVHYVVHGF